ncbi:hypothetical protein CLOSTASPAR_03275 [[Clostridium] asparagiforme DSM 15981]|uniref:Uncharacterized protein n=1 Tax=[Clostridium] asparagiforme DSM 15981 TaxID=518636 RepID=C0D1Y6_9FIRM|nr:hypothetical protein CLOSTASPAR_03275 [[Clostridium] asparagiforme DSM 15981]
MSPDCSIPYFIRNGTVFFLNFPTDFTYYEIRVTIVLRNYFTR